MNAGDLLNADMRTVRAAIAEGFAWWVAELRAMLPVGVRRLFDPRPALLAEVAAGGFVFSRAGRPVAAAGRGDVTLILPADAVLVRRVPAPALSARDLRRALLLDVDRLTPFRAEAVFADVRVSDDSEAVRHADLLVAPRALVLEALARARAAGLRVRAAGVLGPDGRVRFNLLPAVADATGARGGHGWVWSAAVAALLAANVAAWVWRDVADVRRLQGAVDAQAPAVERVAALKRRVLGTEATRLAEVNRRAAQDPGRALAAVARALPPGAWVARWSQTGSTLRLTGYRPAGVDMVAVLRSAGLVHVREGAGDTAAAGTPGGEPFDVSAEIGR